jgi:hypothetical protein
MPVSFSMSVKIANPFFVRKLAIAVFFAVSERSNVRLCNKKIAVAGNKIDGVNLYHYVV